MWQSLLGKMRLLRSWVSFIRVGVLLNWRVFRCRDTGQHARLHAWEMGSVLSYTTFGKRKDPQCHFSWSIRHGARCTNLTTAPRAWNRLGRKILASQQTRERSCLSEGSVVLSYGSFKCVDRLAHWLCWIFRLLSHFFWFKSMFAVISSTPTSTNGICTGILFHRADTS